MADGTTAVLERVGRYRIDGVIGRGAMGVIYRGHDPEIDRVVAIKLVRADLLEGEEREDFVQRFRREAQAAGRCQHPNIVAIHDFGIHEGNPFLTMEFVEGSTLAQQLAGGVRYDPATCVGFVRELLEALEVAHAGGIVHRDIKPANLLLQPMPGRTLPRVKVADFGISRLALSELTTTGAVIGTPSYMSPEQCRGDAVDARTDLFSAGIVLFELLTGEKPFPGKGFTEIAYRVVHEPPAPALACLPGLAPALAACVFRALEKAPEARFQTAAEMAEALRAALSTPVQAGEDDDASRLARPRASIAPGPAGPFDPALTGALTASLARHAGPMARYQVQAEASRAASADQLIEALAAQIPVAADRAAFLAEARRAAGLGTLGDGTARGTARPGTLGGTGAQTATTRATPGAPITPDEVERLTASLAHHVGPIAKLLVKRVLPQAASADALRGLLATHVDEAKRAAFLAGR